VHFASSTLAAKMLRVWKLTGEELVSVSPEELSLLSTARTLKSHLSRLYGFPETLQQLLYDGCLLKDADRLPTPADLQLVLQSALHTDAESDELFYAIHHGYTEAVGLLLAAGAFNQLATWQRNKALVEAADHDVDSNRVEIMRSLLRYAHTDDVNFGRGKVPLVQAAQHGQHEMVSLLLQAGADKDSVDSFRNSALMRACTCGSLEVVLVLLEAHANLELQNHYQQTALLCASIAGHVEVVGALLQAGAGKNRKDCDGDTALGAAALRGHPEIVRMLLDADADPNSRVTPRCAAIAGHAEVARLLTEAQAKRVMYRT